MAKDREITSSSLPDRVLIFATVHCSTLPDALPCERYRLVISHRGNIVLEFSFLNAENSKASARQCLGSFSTTDDIIVRLSTGEDENVERIAIPIICFDRDTASPLQLAYMSMEVDIQFEAICEVKQQSASLFIEGGEELKDANVSISESVPCPTPHPLPPSERRSSSQKRRRPHNVFYLKTTDLYKLIKEATKNLTDRQYKRLARVARVLRLISCYLLETSSFLTLVVIDLSTASLSLLDQLVIKMLEATDIGLELAAQVFVNAVLFFLRVLKKQLSWIEYAAINTMRLSWRLSKPIAQPALQNAHRFIVSSLGSNTYPALFADDLLLTVQELLADD
eukprot:scaffold602_cov179-Ochromonas_danica.AAC.3